jgi:hypothetical protein
MFNLSNANDVLISLPLSFLKNCGLSFAHATQELVKRFISSIEKGRFLLLTKWAMRAMPG